MLSHDAEERYPRVLSERERDWCMYMLPRERSAYAPIARELDELRVLGSGRWGEGDLVLGRSHQTIDLTAPMEPVAVYGEVEFIDGATLSISIHHPDDEGRIEIHFSGVPSAQYETLAEVRRWAFSHWSPGQPSPGRESAPREISLDGDGVLVLVVDSERRLLWLYDGATGGIMLIPVTNFYNELMLTKGVRDPQIALEHRRLFSDATENSDEELRAAFARYNTTFRKVDAERIAQSEAAAAEQHGILARLSRALRRGRP